MIDKSLFVNKNEEKFFKLVESSLGFKREIEDYYINFIEKRQIPDLLGKTVIVSEKQFSQVNKLIEDMCRRLKMEKVDAYIFEDFYYGVESKGVSKGWLEISAKTIEDFTHEQLTFLIGKELYNIKFKNTYYSCLITQGVQNFEMLPLPGADITTEILKNSMYKWHRTMNFSSDNFGMVACGSITSAIEAILMTILNSKSLVKNIVVSEYIAQANKINSLDEAAYNITKQDELVPYGPYRIKNLISYGSSIEAKKAKEQMNS